MEKLSDINRIVVKTGTHLVTNDNGLDVDFIANIARQVATMRLDYGIEVLIVSSGAIASGRQKIPSFGKGIVERQAAAIYGQNIMAAAWIREVDRYGIIAGATVYRDEDLINAKHPLLRALKEGVVIANGHDAVYDPQTEARIISGDNDKLASYLAREIDADLLVMLTDIEDGILDWQGRVVRRIKYNEDLNILRVDKTLNGTGGMESKIESAGEFASFGGAAVVVGGRIPNVLLRILDGEEIGTWIVQH